MPRETKKIEKLFTKLRTSTLLPLTEMSAFIDMSAAATGNANCQLSLNKIIVDTLGGAMRNVLRICAEKINDNFDQLTSLNHDDRFTAIVQLFGLEEEDNVKIIKPAKKPADPTKKNTTKSKAEKKIPVPFWGKQTVKPELCQGLMAGLYNQCTGKPKNGGIYCAKCQKDADSNEGIPKRGNIEHRMEQFRESLYEYTPPGGKLKKIYYYQYVLKNNFTAEDVDKMLKENGIKLNTQGKMNLIYIPEKKTRKPKEENLTDDMEEKPKTPKKKKVQEPEPEPEPEDEDEDNENDDDDTASVFSQSTIATDQTGVTEQNDFDDDDDDIPFPPDDDDEDDDTKPVKKPEPAKKKVTIPDDVDTISMKINIDDSPKKGKLPKKEKGILKKKDLEPEPEPEFEADEEIDITKYRIAKFGDTRYAMLRDADMTEDVDLYAIEDYVRPKDFKITSLKPVGKFNNTTKKVKMNK
jgi:hypothetical protein